MDGYDKNNQISSGTSMVKRAMEEVERKKNPIPLSKIRFESLNEGLSAQIMHFGPYGEAEILTVEKLHNFIRENEYSRRGKHHEI